MKAVNMLKFCCQITEPTFVIDGFVPRAALVWAADPVGATSLPTGSD
jgi:hypothetical protein